MNENKLKDLISFAGSDVFGGSGSYAAAFLQMDDIKEVLMHALEETPKEETLEEFLEKNFA